MTRTVDIVMPRLSDSMEEGVILAWLKPIGAVIAVGDDLVEIETDKATMVYEADVAGTITELLAAEGDSRPVGAAIARVGEPGATPTPASADAGREAPAAAPLRASPLARRVAAANGVDLASIKGEGPFGRILKADVVGAIGRPDQRGQGSNEPPAPAAGGQIAAGPRPASATTATAKGEARVVELSRLQQVLARRMAESKATAPHFYLSVDVDMSAVVAARNRLKDGGLEGVPSLNDFVVKAAALALRDHPRANGAFRDGRFELHQEINVGVAVAAEDALVVPTVFAADRLGLMEIAEATRRAAGSVRDGTITPPELAGGTFTVSNLGMFGIRSFIAVINPPQAAILAVGEVVETVVARQGRIQTAPMMVATLSCDHRILYGADGAAFLAQVKFLLEEPLGLAL